MATKIGPGTIINGVILKKETPREIKLKIPVKPHIKAFLELHFGDNYKLTTKDLLGVFLFHVLKKETNWPSPGFNEKKYPEIFNIIIEARYFFDFGISKIGPTNIIHFNKLIDYLIQFNLKNSIDYLLSPPLDTTKNAIIRYMDDNNINEEFLSFDAYKKTLYRSFKNIKKD